MGERYEMVAHELAGGPVVSQAKMMGNPSLKVGAKMFAGEWHERLIVKIGRERVSELIAADEAEPFDPSGRDRAMKDWALLNEDADWQALAEEAKRFVASGE
jgi:hypothetical protein